MRSVIAPTSKADGFAETGTAGGRFCADLARPSRNDASQKGTNAAGAGPGTHFGGNRNRRRRQRSSVGRMHWNGHGKAPEGALLQIGGHRHCYLRSPCEFGPKRSRIRQIDASRPIGERGSALAAMRGRCVLAESPESGALLVGAVGSAPCVRSHGYSTAGHDRRIRTLQTGACSLASRMSTTDSLE